jgi:antitoxin ChpS
MRIDVPDDIAAALQAKAASQGMSLQAWFQKLAAQKSAKPHYSLNELIQQCDSRAPLSSEDRAWLDAPSVGRETL